MTAKSSATQPEQPTFEPRRVPAGSIYQYANAEGELITLEAEELGDGYAYVEPTDAAGAAMLDSHEAPVARKAIEAEAPAEKPAKSAKQEGA